MLVIQQASYLSYYNLPRYPQGRLRSNQRLIFLIIIYLETPKDGSDPTNSLLAGRRFFFSYPSMSRDPMQPQHVQWPNAAPVCPGTQWSPSMSKDPMQPHHVQGPNAAPQYGGWRYHSTTFGTVEQLETLFWRPEWLSEPPGCQSKCSPTSLVYLSW